MHPVRPITLRDALIARTVLAMRSGAGRTLAGWRKRAGLSQGELAALVGCTQPFVSALENGERTPGLELAAAIERLSFGVIRASDWVPPGGPPGIALGAFGLGLHETSGR